MLRSDRISSYFTLIFISFSLPSHYIYKCSTRLRRLQGRRHTVELVSVWQLPEVPQPRSVASVAPLSWLASVSNRGATAPLKLRKTNCRAQTKFHCRCYLGVYEYMGTRKYENWKYLMKDFWFFPFLGKTLKNMWKKFFKRFFFFTKICFSELEKAYVQLFVLKFFFV